MPMNQDAICKDIAMLHDNILAAGVIEDQHLVARYTKIKDPQADDQRIKQILAQPEIIVSICKTNEDLFGDLRYMILCFDNSDFVYFPATIGSDTRILYIRMERSYRGEEVMEKVYEYLEAREGK